MAFSAPTGSGAEVKTEKGCSDSSVSMFTHYTSSSINLENVFFFFLSKTDIWDLTLISCVPQLISLDWPQIYLALGEGLVVSSRLILGILPIVNTVLGN